MCVCSRVCGGVEDVVDVVDVSPLSVVHYRTYIILYLQCRWQNAFGSDFRNHWFDNHNPRPTTSFSTSPALSTHPCGDKSR